MMTTKRRRVDERQIKRVELALKRDNVALRDIRKQIRYFLRNGENIEWIEDKVLSILDEEHLNHKNAKALKTLKCAVGAIRKHLGNRGMIHEKQTTAT
jgi:hypothetical protein